MKRFAITVVLLASVAAVLLVYSVGRMTSTPPYPHAWIVHLETDGGPIPFRLVLLRRGDGWMVNILQGETGPEIGTGSGESGLARVNEYDREEGVLTVSFPEYDSVLQLEGDISGAMNGHWRKFRGDGRTATLAASTELIEDKRSSDAGGGDAAPFAGRWVVDFALTDDTAVGVFEVNEEQIATGTFLTTTGDYRYLAGRVDGDLMRLSTFDGAHAFLFHARMQDDGTIEGDFWSGNWHHETWTAVRDADAALPDAFGQTVPTEVGVEELAFRGLEGEPTRVADLLDAGGAPARVLYLFGSWCPNCADAGAEMKRLNAKYGDKLTVVGLAFELTEDFERSARQVGLYLERHEADWPVLIAGLSDKAKASAELPVLDRVRAYPTTVFLDADNQIVAVHTGFSGPATGEAYREQQKAFEGVVEGLIGP
jgi:thiol-disulfide isomerase/thioredoxin